MSGPGGPELRSAIEGLGHARRSPPAAAAREQLDERITSFLRLVVAVAGLVIHQIDAAEDAGRRPYVAAVLAAFALYAAAMHLLALRGARRPPAWVTPWLDLAWVTLLIAASSGTSSIFFTLYLFGILCAAFSGGFRSGMAVTVASVLSFAVVGGLTAPRGASFELDRSLIRPMYLFVLGYLMSYWGAHELRLRARLALLREVAALSNPRFGVDRTLGRVLEVVRAFYRADACRLVVTGAGGTWIRAATGAPEAGPRVDVPEPVARVLLPAPHTAALVCGGGWRASLGLRGCEGLDLVRGAAVTPDPAATAALAGVLDARAYVSVPFRWGADALARLHVSSSRPRAFDRSDVEFLLQVLDRVVPVLENVRLVDRLATDAADEERRRIARDLHDSVIQPVVGLRLGLAAAQEALEAGQPEAALRVVERLAGLADVEVQALRRFTRGLAAPEGERHRDPLVPAVRRFCERFSEATGIAVDVAAEGAPAVNDRLAAEVFQLVAEGLSNVRRHTDAARARVRIAARAEQLELEIENDGAPDRGAPLFSPRSLSERAAALGGRLEVLAPEGCGRTAVRVEIPL